MKTSHAFILLSAIYLAPHVSERFGVLASALLTGLAVIAVFFES